MKILQINADRSPRPHDMALQTALEKGADIIVASEPNRRIVAGPEWHSDLREDVAIMILNNRLKIRDLGPHEGAICCGLEEFDVRGCYPNIPEAEYEARLTNVAALVSSRGRKSMVLGDFNAKVPEWGAPVTDRRGQILMEVASQAGWLPLNRGTRPTFTRRGQESHIDVTCQF